jgi:tetratricopeptide (TPR) repeat protein
MYPNARLAQKLGALVCLALFAIPGFGQGRRPPTGNDNDRTASGSIRGRIVMANGSYTNANVKVTLLNIRETISVVYTDTQGQFELRNLNPGNYQLEVEADRQRFDLKTEPVQVFRGTPTVVTIALKEKGDAASSSNAAVSISELDPNIPSSAKKEFEKASKLAAEKNGAEAIFHFRKAIELYPRFVMAYNDLGTQLLASGKLDEAAEALSKAVALDSKAFNPALNLGIVLVLQHKFAEAATILAMATSLEPNSPSARLYAGLAAAGLGDFGTAEKELKTAHELGGTRFATALYHLGNLYLSKGDKESALTSFQLYLREVPDAANGEQVRKTIAMLR